MPKLRTNKMSSATLSRLERIRNTSGVRLSPSAVSYTHLCEEKDLNIPLSYTLLSNAVLLVEEGLGCAFCLDGALAIHSSPHLRFIPIDPEHTTRSVLV